MYAQLVETGQKMVRTLEDMVPTLASHDGGRSICLHAEGHGTVSSTLVQMSWGLPEPPRLLHAAGRPCVTPYQDLSTLIA